MIKFLLINLLSIPELVYANSSNSYEQSWLILALAMIIAGASLSAMVCKFNLPSVIGELILGMLIAGFAHYHYEFFTNLIINPSIALLAEVGSILLLFEIGLESDIRELAKLGKQGAIAAIIGVGLPFIIGAVIVARYIFHSNDIELNLFLGATLAATSTGISVRVFKDLGIIKNRACQIVLTASIIDDILGLMILALVSGMVIAGNIDLSLVLRIGLNVIIFFGGALLLGRKCIPKLVKIFAKVSTNESMIVTSMFAFCLLLSWIASSIGLATIIGAFVAGLIMDELVFREFSKPHWYSKLLELENAKNINDSSIDQDQIILKYEQDRLINLIKPLNYILVPIFFVYAGMQVDVIALLNWHTLFTGVSLSLAAIIGKVFCGIFLPSGINRWVVGFGMVPRGEIGLIFALTGAKLGIFNHEVFAAVLFMVVITSLVTPIFLQFIASRDKSL